MTDEPIKIEVNIEELHIHYPETAVNRDREVTVDVDGTGTEKEPEPEPSVEPEPDEEPPDFVGGGGPPGERPGGYDIRDRPIQGVALEEASKADGVTPRAIAEIHDVNQRTVSSALGHLYRYQALDRSWSGERRTFFYTVTEFGERVLADYRERWENGYRNLPQSYWEGVAVRNAA